MQGKEPGEGSLRVHLPYVAQAVVYCPYLIMELKEGSWAGPLPSIPKHGACLLQEDSNP